MRLGACSGGWEDLKPDELMLLKQKLARCFDDKSQGVREDKITFEGFFVFMQQYIKDLRMEVPWKVLGVHNYDDDLRLLVRNTFKINNQFMMLRPVLYHISFLT
jgi:hypothetical protein